MSTVYPKNYLLQNEQQTKQLNLVLCIDGLDYCFGLVPTYTRVRYGDAGVYYGQPGIVYGGLRPLENVKPWLSFESSLTISQRLEPEQARASIGQMSMVLIDKDGQVSKLVSPGGGVLPEILGRDVSVKLGYNNTSYPEDYFTVFRGLITDVTIQTGKVTLTFGDAGQKRRTSIFRKVVTTLSAGINDSTLTIPTVNSSGFLLPVQQPSGGYDAGVTCYALIGSELIQLANSGHTQTSLVATARGARGTVAGAHLVNDPIESRMELTGNALDLALKTMLSGFAGPFETGVSVTALGVVTDTNLPTALNAVCLGASDNAVDHYGLALGDWVTISGSTAGNDGTYRVAQFGDNFEFPNTILYLDADLTPEVPAPTVTLSFRSQYDTLPVEAGLKIHPKFVDVASFESYRANYFSGTENTLEFFLSEQTSGKEFIERELFAPLGAYSLTRYGRLSIGYTRPPLPGQNLVFLDATNVVEPVAISQQRGLNTRKFFNEIQYEYDYADATSAYQKVIRSIDTESLSLIGIRNMLPIQARGVKTLYGGGILANRTSLRLLSRYRRAALIVSLKTLWKTGSLIEAGDVVVLTDNGDLKITSLSTGERTYGQGLFEVIDRTIDVKTGSVSLKLVNGLESNLSDRYGTISPASLVSATNTTYTQIELKKSFGNAGQYEGTKWADYVGLQVRVRDASFSNVATATLVELSETNPNLMTVTPALPFLPGENYVVELVEYDDSTAQSLAKLLHAYQSPTVTATSAPTAGAFTVGAGDVSKFWVNAPIVFYSSDHSSVSSEGAVTDITGTTISYSGASGWAGSIGDRVELIGFAGDEGGPYRLI